MKAFLFACAMLTMPLPGLAAGVCRDRSELLASLERIHGEVPRFAALLSDGRVFEFIVAPDGQSWTLLVTDTDGTTCAVAVGTAFVVAPAGDPA
jgi:hypothetical protein